MLNPEIKLKFERYLFLPSSSNLQFSTDIEKANKLRWGKEKTNGVRYQTQN